MKRDLGPDVLFNTVMMMRMRSRKSVLVTESERDTDLYKKFVSENDCLVGSSSHRSGVLDALERFSRYRVGGCAGIIDADADYFLNRPKPALSVYRTDKTDKETTIIDSAAFSDFCRFFSARLPAGTLRAMLYEAALPLGVIRRMSIREGWGLDFKGVVISRFIETGPVCNLTRCCEEVALLNPQSAISVQTLTDLLADVRSRSLPPTHVVQGHDLITIIALHSQSIFGRNLSQWEIGFGLSKAYTIHHFKTTNTYSDLRIWENSALPYFRMFAGH
jgi:hypothetical protein